MLIDITDGAAGAAEGISAAAGLLGCDLVVYADVGGDALATGDEPGLGSPLCDAVMLAAAIRLAPRLDGAIAVLGAGCDGELTLDEVLGRIAALAAAGAWIGSSSVTPAIADDLERAAAATGTEASMQMVRCARGETRRGGDPRRAAAGAARARRGAHLLLRPRGGRAGAAAGRRPSPATPATSRPPARP